MEAFEEFAQTRRHHAGVTSVVVVQVHRQILHDFGCFDEEWIPEGGHGKDERVTIDIEPLLAIEGVVIGGYERRDFLVTDREITRADQGLVAIETLHDWRNLAAEFGCNEVPLGSTKPSFVVALSLRLLLGRRRTPRYAVLEPEDECREREHENENAEAHDEPGH